MRFFVYDENRGNTRTATYIIDLSKISYFEYDPMGYKAPTMRPPEYGQPLARFCVDGREYCLTYDAAFRLKETYDLYLESELKRE